RLAGALVREEIERARLVQQHHGGRLVGGDGGRGAVDRGHDQRHGDRHGQGRQKRPGDDPPAAVEDVEGVAQADRLLLDPRGRMRRLRPHLASLCWTWRAYHRTGPPPWSITAGTPTEPSLRVEESTSGC